MLVDPDRGRPLLLRGFDIDWRSFLHLAFLIWVSLCSSLFVVDFLRCGQILGKLIGREVPTRVDQRVIDAIHDFPFSFVPLALCFQPLLLLLFPRIQSFPSKLAFLALCGLLPFVFLFSVLTQIQKLQCVSDECFLDFEI